MPRTSRLPITFLLVPVLLLAVGEKDTLIEGIRSFGVQLDQLQVEHEFIVKPGLDHGTIIMGAEPDVFRFFAKHVKGAAQSPDPH